MVAKPPPYILMMTAQQATNSGTLPMAPVWGTSTYSTMPRMKKQK